MSAEPILTAEAPYSADIFPRPFAEQLAACCNSIATLAEGDEQILAALDDFAQSSDSRYSRALLDAVDRPGCGAALVAEVHEAIEWSRWTR